MLFHGEQFAGDSSQGCGLKGPVRCLEVGFQINLRQMALLCSNVEEDEQGVMWTTVSLVVYKQVHS